MTSLHTASALEVAARLRSAELSVEEYAKALLAVAEKGQARIHAWAYLDPETVLSQARELDKIPIDRRGPLHGLPFGIKDIFLTQGTVQAGVYALSDLFHRHANSLQLPSLRQRPHHPP